jgi:hypothetical protein
VVIVQKTQIMDEIKKEIHALVEEINDIPTLKAILQILKEEKGKPQGEERQTINLLKHFEKILEEEHNLLKRLAG